MTASGFMKMYSSAGALGGAVGITGRRLQGAVGALLLGDFVWNSREFVRTLGSDEMAGWQKAELLAELVGGFAGMGRAGAFNAVKAGQAFGNRVADRFIGFGIHNRVVKAFPNLHARLSSLAHRAGFRVCFVAGTPIVGVLGSKAIEDYKDYETYGDDCDTLISRDEFNDDGILTVRRVLRRFERIGPVLDVVINGQRIGTTHEHPFFVKGQGWTKAQELRIGDLVRLMQPGWATVEAIEDTGRLERVYNLEIEDDHTYFVGDPTTWGFSVWAHNAFDYSITHGTFKSQLLEDAYLAHVGFASRAGRQSLNRASWAIEHQKVFKGNGAFRDAALAQRYSDYVARKQAKGLAVRGRGEWYEWSTFFGSYGPTARGNQFNRTAVNNKWYSYNEVHLSNGMRLDSYVPGKAIVSRKAIDFDTLSATDFGAHLSEFAQKYSRGTTIRSNKYPFLDTKSLRGKYILEVPDSNLLAANRQEFEAAAAQAKVSIRYRPE